MKKRGEGGAAFNHSFVPATSMEGLVRAMRGWRDELAATRDGARFIAPDATALPLAGDSEREVGDLDELVGVEHAFAPDGIEIGERLFCDGFVGGFSGRLQFLYAIAGGDEHVAEFREVRFVAE